MAHRAANDGVVLYSPYYGQPRCKRRYSTGEYRPYSWGGLGHGEGCYRGAVKEGFCAEHHHEDTEYLQGIFDRLLNEYLDRDRESDERERRMRIWKQEMRST